MLRYTTEDGRTVDKVRAAIDRLKAFEPEEGYYLAFSGGKDSQCIYHLAVMAGVKFRPEYNVTSVDPPELVRFIKTQYPDVHMRVPKDKNGRPVSMWSLIPKKLIPPSRWNRYCCEVLKESGGPGMITVTGVRWAESVRRKNTHGTANIWTRSKKLLAQADDIEGSSVNHHGGIVLNDDNDAARRMVEQCYRTRKTLVNPIVDWEDEDVWEFLNDVAKVPHCELYDQGYARIGCLGCPLTRHGGEELKRYPKYYNLYMIAFRRMLENRAALGKETGWKSAEEIMAWFLNKCENKGPVRPEEDR